MKELRKSYYISKGLVSRRSNVFLVTLVRILFRGVDFDPESIAFLKSHYTDKKTVFVSFQSSNTSMLILINLLRRHGFKSPDLAMDFTPNLIQIFSNSYRKVNRYFTEIFSKENLKSIHTGEYMKQLIDGGRSIVLSLLSRKSFLRRFVDIKADALHYLVDIQKQTDDPIYIIPQITYWNRNPDRTNMFMTLKATGDRGLFSALFTMFKSATPAFVKLTVPINLKEEMASYETDDSSQIARKIRNKLLEIYANDKKVVLGPVIKSQQEMMEKVLYHRNVMDTLQEIVKDERKKENKLRKKAYKYFREIAADFSIVYIKYFEKACSMLFNKIFDGIIYKLEDFAKVREAAQKAPLIIVPCHRSHMDYLIISSLFYINKIIPPHIVAGSNLTFWPMGTIFRRSGAFFMRRSFKGLKLYASIFRQYIKSLVNEGYSIEFFIEGGRTRTGKLGFPKMGIMKYLLDSVDEGYAKDLMFVPISINYDRILEESSYHHEIKGKAKKNESTAEMVKSVSFLKRNYGNVYLDFHDPFSYKEFKAGLKEGDDLLNNIGSHIIRNINEIVAVTPFSLVSAALLLSTEKGFTLESVKEKVLFLHSYLKFCGANLPEKLSDTGNIDNVIDQVFKAYIMDHIIFTLKLEQSKDENAPPEPDLLILNEDQRSKINFYQNSIVHYYLGVSFVSLGILYTLNGKKTTVDEVTRVYLDLMTLFSNEFVFSYDMYKTDEAVRKEIDYLKSRSVISESGGKITLQDGKDNDLILYVRIIQDFLESYFIVLSTVCSVKRTSIMKKELIMEVRKNGIKMFHLGTIKLPEALSLPNYNNAVLMLEETGIIEDMKYGKKNQECSLSDMKKAEIVLEQVRKYLTIIG
jgi:glycerol-3-phosphate O-acyltransferase